MRVGVGKRLQRREYARLMRSSTISSKVCKNRTRRPADNVFCEAEAARSSAIGARLKSTDSRTTPLHPTILFVAPAEPVLKRRFSFPPFCFIFRFFFQRVSRRPPLLIAAL